MFETLALQVIPTNFPFSTERNGHLTELGRPPRTPHPVHRLSLDHPPSPQNQEANRRTMNEEYLSPNSWFNKAAAVFDRMLCCSYAGQQLFAEEPILDFDENSILQRSTMRPCVDDDVMEARPYPRVAVEADDDQELMESAVGDVIPPSYSQHTGLEHHGYIFLTNSKDHSSSIKPQISTASPDHLTTLDLQESVKTPNSCSTSTTASINSMSEHSVRTLSTCQTMGTSASDGLAETIKQQHRPKEIAVPKKDKPLVLSIKPHRTFHHPRRWSETFDDPAMASIYQLQSESLHELPRLSKTQGYRC